MRNFLPLLLILIACTCGRAQKSTVTELRAQLEKTKADADQHRNIYHKIFVRSLADSTTATALLDTLATLSRQVNTPHSRGLLALESAYYQDRYGEIDDAKEAAKVALEEFKQTDKFEELAIVYRRLGYYAYTERDFEATYRYAELELNAARKVNDDTFIGSAYVNLAIASRQSGNAAGALAYNLTALKYLEKTEDSAELASLLLNLGGSYNSARNFKADSAAYFIKRALDLMTRAEKPEPRRIGKAYGALARVHARNKDLDEALKSATTGMAYIREGGIISDNYEITFYVGNLYQRTGNYPQAKRYLYEAVDLARQEEKIDPTWLYYSLGEYYKGLRNVDSTAHYLQKYAGAIAKAQAKKRSDVVAELDAKFQNKEKQAEIDRLALEDQVKSLQLKRQNWLIGGGLLVLGLLGSLLYFLLQQRGRIRAQNATITQALDEKNTLLKEIHHRVKNNLQMVSSLLSLQSDYIEDDAALDALKMGQSRVRSMAIIHQKLYMRDQVSTAVSAKDYLDQLISELMQTLNVSGIPLKMSKQIEDINLDIDSLIPLGLVANEVITNAMKYAFVNRDSGKLDIDFRRNGEDVELIIADDGPGLGRELSESSHSFGSLLIRTFAEQLEGSVEVDGTEGTRVALRFPFA